jgi:hypothetical protein
MRHWKVSNPDDLLVTMDPKIIEAQIIGYVKWLVSTGISYNAIKVQVAPIYTYYELNDFKINKRKIAKYYPDIKRVVQDKAYSIEQIQTMLQNADQRTRMIILLFTSTGCRIGALPDIVFRDLTRIPEYGLYRIQFYVGTNNEYYTFTTREAASTGIDNYLLYRQRCGEKITFNEKLNRWEPDDTPLIRQQFDINDVLQARNPQPLSHDGLRMVLEYHLVKCGLREFEHMTEGSNPSRIRKPVSLSKGFRKFVISTFIEAGLNHEIRELIVDHDTELDKNYFRPSEEQVLREYLKAESFLTIDPSMRLAQEVQTLKIEKSKMEMLEQKMAEYDKVLGLA